MPTRAASNYLRSATSPKQPHSDAMKLRKATLHSFASFAAGAFSALAMPPWSLFPVLILTLGTLYYLLLSATSGWQAFLRGWLFGFGYFLLGLLWVGNALLIDGNPYAWAWPLAVCGLPFILAFFPAFAALCARSLGNLSTVSGFLAFTAYIALFEWARGWVFTGFPWNLYGHTWADILPVLQVLSISNIYWLTWLTVLWCAAPTFFYLRGWRGVDRAFLAGLVVLTLSFCLSFGYWRLQQPPPADVSNVQIHMVQANIPQSEKWDQDKIWEHFLKHIDLSRPRSTIEDKTTYIVWAETALSQWVIDDPRAMDLIRETLALYPGEAYLLTGLLRFEPGTGNAYNALVMIDNQGNVTNVYDKNHLVPFGEYIPFQEWIPLEPVARFKGFAGGKGPQTFTTPQGIKYSPVICYEIIFSGKVVKPDERPDFILNVTNDSWYGDSGGPKQHLKQAVFRAIEEGIPVVRVADTGVTAIINSQGYILEKSELFHEYEKTLALPGSIMVNNSTNNIRTRAFLTLLLLTMSFGFFSNKK